MITPATTMIGIRIPSKTNRMISTTAAIRIAISLPYHVEKSSLNDFCFTFPLSEFCSRAEPASVHGAVDRAVASISLGDSLEDEFADDSLESEGYELLSDEDLEEIIQKYE